MDRLPGICCPNVAPPPQPHHPALRGRGLRVKVIAPASRWYRCARPPANRCDPIRGRSLSPSFQPPVAFAEPVIRNPSFELGRGTGPPKVGCPIACRACSWTGGHPVRTRPRSKPCFSPIERTGEKQAFCTWPGHPGPTRQRCGRGFVDSTPATRHRSMLGQYGLETRSIDFTVLILDNSLAVLDCEGDPLNDRF